jgi:uncharacterized protein YkwD
MRKIAARPLTGINATVFSILTAVILASISCVPKNSASSGAHRTTKQSDSTGAQSSTATQPTNTQPTNTSTAPNQPEISTPPESQQPSDCYKASAFVCKVESLIVAKTNRYRASRSLSPLASDAKMAFVSRDWSAQQGRSGFISHRGFPSSRNALYRTEFQLSFSFAAENVAYTGRVRGSDESDATAERIAEEFAVMWWNSAGHRANMLGRFSKIGVGVHKTTGGNWYATQLFK